jgi:hypothetical protein
MSHKWTANAYGTISNKAMQEVQREIQTEPFIASHDNVNIPLQVFSQRLHNQSHFISGCTATIWILPKDAALPEDANRAFQMHQAEGSKTCFDYGELLDGDEEIEPMGWRLC